MQIVTMICGLILPRMILVSYGSDVNGLVNSITQFLSFITLLDGGVGAVIRAAYYRPMVTHDNDAISGVFAASNKLYRQIAGIFVIYIGVLAIVFPMITANKFGFLYTNVLVIIISLSTFMQYYWGCTLKLLVFSDQKGYLHSITQILTTIINTVLAVILIKFGAGIHIVKLVAAIAYIIQPLLLGYYIKKNYKINYRAKPAMDTLSQRWNALARHIAFYIHSNTDVAILTLFTNFGVVSIYSVYKIVVNGLTNLVSGIIGNTEATFGNLLASEENCKFETEFKSIDILTKYISTICFTTCTIMLCKFVAIYTNGIIDIDYQRPMFAILLCASEWIYCMGLNYNNVIISVGHFKQTTKIAIAEASINVILSVLLVWIFGLEGVVAATCIAMTYKMISNIWYMNKNVVCVNNAYTVKSIMASILSAIVSFFLLGSMLPNVNTYTLFFIEASCVFIIVAIISIAFDLILCRNETLMLMRKLINNILRKTDKKEKQI